MGKVSDKDMDRKDANGKRLTQHEQTQEEGRSQRTNTTTRNTTENTDETRLFRCLSHAPSSDSGENVSGSRLAASTSSPSLLTGCANVETHAGATIERHVHSHNVRIVSQSPPLSPIPVSPHPTLSDDSPFQANPRLPNPSPPPTPSSEPDIPPDSVFLTPSQTRTQHLTPERPSSAPSNYLERISGTLLRLVGDHYLCSTCGRQLRTIGDQLTMETNINHIRRAFSATHLDTNGNGN